MVLSTWQSLLNMVYLTFFCIHVPIMFMVDLYPLYPATFRPSFLTDIRQWYLATYKDRFFTAQAPAWFWFFMIMEAGYHVPFSVYAIGKLWGRHDSPTLHLNLLIFALQTTLTTATCIVEYHSWPELTANEKSNLGGLYIPYLVFAVVMGVDMYGRVRRSLGMLGGTKGK